MDRDRGKGILNKAKGAFKRAVGRVTGDRKIQAEGHFDRAKGEVQNTVGGVKDSLRNKP
jgi:uncharacterized protein YjbJ (UPF0337 family)